jgi:hypothetical protein
LNSAGTVAALTINTGGTLDMGSNSLTINYAAGIDPVAAIRGYLKSAYNGGVWTGAGLTSSAVEAEVAAIGSSGRGMWGIGYADGSVDTKQTVAVGNQLVLEPALTGDADLNGAVNFLDLGIAAQNLGMVNGDWEHGDFNYDGNVNFLDVALLAQNLDETGINTPLSAVTPASELVGTAAALTWELTTGLPPVAAGSAPGAVAAVASPPNGAEEAMFAVWPNSTAAPDGLFGNVSLANILK